MADTTRRVVLELLARNRAAGEMASFNRGLDGVRSGAKRLAGSLLALAGVGGGLYMLQRGIRGVITAAMEQEKVERQLSAALMTTGDASEFVTNSLKKYAAGLQRVTIYGDEEIISQMAYAKNLGVTTGKLEEATKAAIGLAARYRIDLKTAMMLVGRAALGQTQMLTRYGIILDESLTTQEKFNALLKIGADNFALAKAETQTAEGALKRFKNAMGDIGESIGGLFLPAITDAANGVTNLINKTNALSEAALKYKQITGDVAVGTRKFYPGSMGPGGVSAPAKPEYPGTMDLFQRQALAGEPIGLFPPQSIIDEAAAKSAKAGAGAGAFDPTDELQKQLAKEDQIRLAASIKIEDKIAKMTLSTHDYKLRLLEEEIDKYREAGVQEVTIAEFRNERIKELAEELAKSAKDANQDIMKAAQGQVDFVRDLEGISVRERIQNLSDYVEANAEALEAVAEAHQILYDEIERLREVDKTNWDRYWDDLTFHMENFYHNVGDKIGTFAAESESHLSDALYDYFTKAKSWEEAMEALWDDVLRSFIRMCARMIAEAIMFATLKAALGIGGAAVGGASALFGVAHAGGIVGETPFPKRLIPAKTFIGAPRLHGGLASDEYPAILQRGEQVIPRDGNAGGGGVTVNITNNANVDVEVDESMDQRTINLVINAMQTHGPMRRAVSSVRR